MLQLGLSHTQDLVQVSLMYSYRHASLNARSLIDHFLVSDSLKHNVSSIAILDDGDNISDHLPIIITFVR